MGRFQSASLFLNGYRRYIAAAAAALFNTPNIVHPAVAAGSGYTPLKQKSKKKKMLRTHSRCYTLSCKKEPTQHETCCCWWEIFPQNQWGKMSKRYINTAEKTHKREGNLKWLSAVLLNYPRKYKKRGKKE